MLVTTMPEADLVAGLVALVKAAGYAWAVAAGLTALWLGVRRGC